MSDETAITLPFADGDYRFFLPLARVVAAEREADCSIFQLFHDIGEHVGAFGDDLVLAGPSPARIKQCHALIRNALIGGGAGEDLARELVSTYCYPARGAVSDLGLAYKILGAAIYGVRLKKKAEDQADGLSRSEKATSSSTAQSSGSTGNPPRSARTSKRSKRTTKPTTPNDRESPPSPPATD